MVHLGDVPPNFIKVISNAVSIFLLVALFFILQYLFDMDFFCSCRPGVHLSDVVLLTGPPLILTLIVTQIESFYQKWIFLCCSNYCWNNFCSCFVKFLMKCVFLSAVWVSTVLFDGDWYFCLLTNLNTSQTGLPCKENLTYEETLIKTDDKNVSRVWGFLVISGIILLWTLSESCKASCIRWKMWQRSSVSRQDLFCSPYYRWLYEDLLRKEVSDHLKEELKNIANERAKKLCKKYLTIIRNHELSEPTGILHGSNVTNPNNPNANGDNNPNGIANENPAVIANEHPTVSVNEHPTVSVNENPAVHVNERPDDNFNEHPAVTVSAHPTDIANENPAVSVNENPAVHVNERPDGNFNERSTGIANENPAVSVNEHPIVSVNEPTDCLVRENPAVHVNVRPAVSVSTSDGNANGNREKDKIFDAWQNISLSHFYLMDEVSAGKFMKGD